MTEGLGEEAYEQAMAGLPMLLVIIGLVVATSIFGGPLLGRLLTSALAALGLAITGPQLAALTGLIAGLAAPDSQIEFAAQKGAMAKPQLAGLLVTLGALFVGASLTAAAKAVKYGKATEAVKENVNKEVEAIETEPAAAETNMATMAVDDVYGMQRTAPLKEAETGIAAADDVSNMQKNIPAADAPLALDLDALRSAPIREDITLGRKFSGEAGRKYFLIIMQDKKGNPVRVNITAGRENDFRESLIDIWNSRKITRGYGGNDLYLPGKTPGVKEDITTLKTPILIMFEENGPIMKCDNFVPGERMNFVAKVFWDPRASKEPIRNATTEIGATGAQNTPKPFKIEPYNPVRGEEFNPAAVVDRGSMSYTPTPKQRWAVRMEKVSIVEKSNPNNGLNRGDVLVTSSRDIIIEASSEKEAIQLIGQNVPKSVTFKDSNFRVELELLGVYDANGALIGVPQARKLEGISQQGITTATQHFFVRNNNLYETHYNPSEPSLKPEISYGNAADLNADQIGIKVPSASAAEMTNSRNIRFTNAARTWAGLYARSEKVFADFSGEIYDFTSTASPRAIINDIQRLRGMIEDINSKSTGITAKDQMNYDGKSSEFYRLLIAHLEGVLRKQ